MIKASGMVTSGKQRGRKLGFPTANISISYQIDSGVYAGQTLLDNSKYKSIIYVDDSGHLIETHLVNFSGNIYGKTIEVELGKKIRDIKQFTDDRDLICQIKKDICSLE